MPVASKTSPLNLSGEGASEFHTLASRSAAAAASRRCSCISVATSTPAEPRMDTTVAPSLPPGAAPTSTRPSTNGLPGSQRWSGVGTGSPTFFAISLPTGALTIWE